MLHYCAGLQHCLDQEEVERQRQSETTATAKNTFDEKNSSDNSASETKNISEEEFTAEICADAGNIEESELAAFGLELSSGVQDAIGDEMVEMLEGLVTVKDLLPGSEFGEQAYVGRVADHGGRVPPSDAQSNVEILPANQNVVIACGDDVNSVSSADALDTLTAEEIAENCLSGDASKEPVDLKLNVCSVTELSRDICDVISKETSTNPSSSLIV